MRLSVSYRTTTRCGPRRPGRAGRRVWFVVVSSALFIAGNASAQQLGDPLTAPAVGVDAQFGYSVSVSGHLAVVGAPYDRLALADGEVRAGAAYVFDLFTGTQLHALSDGGLADDAAFGFAVAIDGDAVIVGVPGDDDAGTATGSAYVFDATTGQLARKLVLPGGREGDLFGHSVALQAGLAVIGAPGDSHNPREQSTGAMYVFDIATGNQVLPRLVANDARVDQLLGWSVAIDGNNIMVGAPEDGDASGAAYVFDRITGTQIHKLSPDDPDPTFFTFGASVALAGNIGLIGAPGDGHAGSSAGSAYLFDTVTGQQLHKLMAADQSDHEAFGYSVALDGNLAVIGASGDTHAGDNSGSAYLFGAGSGQQIQKWTANDSSPQDRLGHAVSIQDHVALVGAILHDQVLEDGGAAYVFEYCRADLNGDLVIDVLDLLELVQSWGVCPAPCRPDVNHDGVVSVLDLLEVLTGWGPCP